MRRVQETMGIPVIVEVCDEDVEESAIDRAFQWLDFVDTTFSTYKPHSEISRINAGELSPSDAHPAVRSVLGRCERLRRETLGYFDISAPRLPEAAGTRANARTIDPSGFVKGWAIEGAGRILGKAGARNWSVNAGGDVCLRGTPPGQRGWRVGVQHPTEKLALAAVLELSSGAVATSGTYERGAHIVDPHTHKAPRGLLSVTITGDDLATVDAYATAAFAMGRKGAEWAARLPGHGAIAIFDDDRIAYSAGVERHLVEAAGRPATTAQLAAESAAVAAADSPGQRAADALKGNRGRRAA